MSKRKNKKSTEELSHYILEDIDTYDYRDAINDVKLYLNLTDGSSLPQKYEWEIYNLFSQHPNLIKLICCACKESGSF